MSCQHLFLRGAKKGQACARHLIEGETDYCNHHKNMVHHVVTKCQGRKIVEGRYVPCEEMTMSINCRCKQHKLHKVTSKIPEVEVKIPEIIEAEVKVPEIIEIKVPEIIEVKVPEIIEAEAKVPEIIEVKAEMETTKARVFIEKPKRAYVKKTERKLTACDMAALG